MRFNIKRARRVGVDVQPAVEPQLQSVIAADVELHVLVRLALRLAIQVRDAAELIFVVTDLLQIDRVPLVNVARFHVTDCPPLPSYRPCALKLSSGG